jgi:Ca2+-binding RTX toxin-like protein
MKARRTTTLLIAVGLSLAAVPVLSGAAWAQPPEPTQGCQATMGLTDPYPGYTVIEGDAGANVLVGTPGPDIVVGYGGNDWIYGLGGDDVLIGGPGDDVIFGGPGDDCADGSGGDDLILGNEDDDTLFGDQGSDSLYGNKGDDWLFGYDSVGIDAQPNGPQVVNTLDGGEGSNHCITGTWADDYDLATCVDLQIRY